ncbi:hypothetical protein EMCRGX_G030988 [Ephydatia muelleri]
MDVSIDGTCVLLRMKQGENRINPEFVEDFHKALDRALSYETATCLVTIGDELPSFASDVQRLLARLLTFPLVTVAALNGHTFAGGAFIAFAHDYCVMQTSKGWLCLPEIRLKLQFTAGLIDLAKIRIPKDEHTRAIVLGHKYTAEEAKLAGLIKDCCPLEDLENRAKALAVTLSSGKPDRQTMSVIKTDLYHDVYTTLMQPIRNYSRL